MLKAENIDSMVTLPAKIIFRGVNFHKKMEEKEAKKIFLHWSYGSGCR